MAVRVAVSSGTLRRLRTFFEILTYVRLAGDFGRLRSLVLSAFLWKFTQYT